MKEVQFKDVPESAFFCLVVEDEIRVLFRRFHPYQLPVMPDEPAPGVEYVYCFTDGGGCSISDQTIR